MLDKRRFRHVPPRELPESQVEMRISTLRKKAKAENLDIPYEVITYLAHRLDLDRIQLEEALIRVVAYSSIINRDIDIHLAVEALGGINHKGSKEKKAISKKRSLLSRTTVIAMLSGILLLNGCELKRESSAPVVTKKVDNTAKAAEVSIQQDITLSGQTEPFQVVYLSPSISGNVKEMYVDIGAYVKKDQVLAKIDESDLAYQIKQAEANVKQVEVEAHMRGIEQQINLNEMKVTLSTESAIDAEEQKYLIQSLQMDLENAQKNWDRNHTLFSEGAITQEQLEQAQTQKTQAENELAKAKKLIQLKGAKAKDQKQAALSVAKLEKQSAHAAAKLTKMGVEQAKADLELIRYQYNNLTVKAPINGFVMDIKSMMGQAVSPSDPMFVITNLDKLYVRADVPEALINRVKMGQQASINVPTIGKSLQGKVVYVAPLADPKTQAFPIRVLIDNADHEIKGGMRTQVSIRNEAPQAASQK